MPRLPGPNFDKHNLIAAKGTINSIASAPGNTVVLTQSILAEVYAKRLATFTPFANMTPTSTSPLSLVPKRFSFYLSE